MKDVNGISKPETHPVLLVRGLGKFFFRHNMNVRIDAFRSLSLDVWPGKLTALTGFSGSGKSSALKCIYRTYKASGGEILFRCLDGRVLDLSRLSDKEVLEYGRSEIGFVTQYLHCVPRQSAVQVVSKPLLDWGMKREEAADLSRSMLRDLGLPEKLWSLPPATFSGGERQKVNLAKGILAGRNLLLLDEPTSSLDPVAIDLAIDAIQRRQSAGVGVLATFHDPELVSKHADFTIDMALADEQREQFAR
ncbi:MAG: ATP-binding cassette domain-containing protein [Bryobacteraceae bacterium]|nr:ATP-binding cassette domain-containing protein [Bryobacteraceae bacterium]